MGVDVVVMNHDPDVLDALATAVADAGLTVASCFAQRTVAELAAFLREHEPRAVVYDLGPPPVDLAVEKWRRLCQEPGGYRPYVLTTTHADAHSFDPHPCMVDCVLLKPVALDELTQAVRRASGR